MSTMNTERQVHRMIVNTTIVYITNSIYDVVMNTISCKLININSVNNYHR